MLILISFVYLEMNTCDVDYISFFGDLMSLLLLDFVTLGNLMRLRLMFLFC